MLSIYKLKDSRFNENEFDKITIECITDIRVLVIPFDRTKEIKNTNITIYFLFSP